MAFTLIIIGVFIFNLKTPTIAKPKEKGPRQKRLLTFSWRRRKSKETASTNLLSKTEQGSEGILRGPNEPVLSSNFFVVWIPCLYKRATDQAVYHLIQQSYVHVD